MSEILPTKYEEKETRSDETLKCCECRDEIKPGQLHKTSSWILDKKEGNMILCMVCDTLMRKVIESGESIESIISFLSTQNGALNEWEEIYIEWLEERSERLIVAEELIAKLQAETRSLNLRIDDLESMRPTGIIKHQDENLDLFGLACSLCGERFMVIDSGEEWMWWTWENILTWIDAMDDWKFIDVDSDKKTIKTIMCENHGCSECRHLDQSGDTDDCKLTGQEPYEICDKFE